MSWHAKPALVESGQAALAEMARAREAGEPFALVLLDGQMPEMDGFSVAAQIKRHSHFADAAIVMLTSSGQPDDTARCRELGVAAYLTKPVMQAELLEAILTALGQASPPPERRPLIEDRAPRQIAGKPRILLAEDNAVNQKLAVHLLEKHGYTVTVTANGREAVMAFERESFDLILMDVQMPEVNGFEATAAVRATERATGRRIPIIAMTAHAMKGDRERCLAAGMDGYVAKPIQAQALFAAIESLLPASTQNAAETAAKAETAASKPSGVMDLDAVLNRLGGDHELLAEMASLFLEDGPRILRETRAAITRRDSKALERAAHTLKGSASNFTSHSVCEAALRLERM